MGSVIKKESPPREWNKKENPTLEREEKWDLKSETFENIVDKKVQLYKNEISQRHRVRDQLDE